MSRSLRLASKRWNLGEDYGRDMEPSESALRVLSTMFDAADEGGDDEHGHHAAFKITASRPVECGCHNERQMVPMSRAQF
jgi:hypothetical protein